MLIFIFFRLNIKFILLKFFGFFNLTLFFDWIRVLFLGVLFLILGRVLYFSKIYMQDEEIRLGSFILMILSFVLSMVILIVSGDWLRLIIGWDWLGITSFFLVAFYNREKGWVGRLKTFFTNRIGDGVFLFLMRVILVNFIFKIYFLKIYLVLVLILFCQTKRAQLPFRAWLPAAMAAPTPVSALVHSSTLVTAGVYILFRAKFLIFSFFKYLKFLGLLTLFIGRFRACGRFDLKKIVAFSTLSHLGFMFIGLSRGIVFLRFFHLVVHACFKALLFIRAGMLIFLNGHSQDFRQVKFNFKNLFFIWVGLIRVLRLGGVPFFSGFFSKDFILEYFFWRKNFIFYFLFFISIFFSVYYRFRLVKKFLKIKWGVRIIEKNNKNIFFLLVLLFGRVVIGLILRKMFKKYLFLPLRVFFKVVIYFFMLGGVFVFKIKFKSYLARRILFLDSLGGFFIKIKKDKLKKIFFNLDQGNIAYVRENIKIVNLFNKKKFFLKVNLFYFFWLFLVIFILW